MAHSNNVRLAAFAASVLFPALFLSSNASSLVFTLTAEDAAILPGPLSMDLEGISISQPESARLYRIDGDKKIPLVCQADIGRTTRLWFVPDQAIPQGTRVTLELTFEAAATPAGPLTATVDETAITLRYNNKSILCYQHALHPVPEGVDPIFRRSGFIHPLYTPDGLVVTCIQPRDHYHHYGIWNPWTVTQIDGREVDFWNLAKGQGTVRFAGLLSTTAGPVYSGFKARQEHVMFVGEEKTEKVAINEMWDVRAAAMTLDGRTVWVVDLTTTLSNALTSDIELSAYRYGGGLGFRATDDWNKDNLVVLTNEGKTRNDADGTRARWADVRGAGRNKSGTAGVLFLSHAANREHPEPMRVWPESGGPNGVMFFEFCPIRHNAWTLKPNTEYVLRYRMLIYDGTITPETAEVLWKNFAQPPVPVRTLPNAL
jgi:hypothetical protein